MATKSNSTDCANRNLCSVGRPVERDAIYWAARQEEMLLLFRTIMICTVIGFFAAPPTFAERQPNRNEIVITEFAWTNNVDSKRNHETRYETYGPTAPIVFWTKVRANREALKFLSDDGRLPIWHKWFVSCGSTVQFDGKTDPIDAIDLGIPSESLIQQLEIEIKNNGYFDWRTWSRKENVSSCWYTIRIVDNKNNPLYCGEVNDDCEFSIRLRR